MLFWDNFYWILSRFLLDRLFELVKKKSDYTHFYRNHWFFLIEIMIFTNKNESLLTLISIFHLKNLNHSAREQPPPGSPYCTAIMHYCSRNKCTKRMFLLLASQFCDLALTSSITLDSLCSEYVPRTIWYW